MRDFIKKGMHVAAALFGLSLFHAPAASAQDLPIETLQSCGASIETNVVSSRYIRNIKSTAFTPLFSGRFLLTPGILADCVIVTFNAEAACKGVSKNDQCMVRVLANGVEMQPAPTDEDRILVSESNNSPSAHTYSWIRRGLLVGASTFTIEVRVGAAGTVFVIDDWLLRVEYFS